MPLPPARAVRIARRVLPAQAAAEPSFAQLTGTSDCIAEQPSFFNDCVDGRRLETAGAIARQGAEVA